MLIDIDDDFAMEIVVKMLKGDADNLRQYLAEGKYWMEEDRFYDERLLAALEVVIENFSVPDMIQERLF